jgi:hypothetical protein
MMMLVPLAALVLGVLAVFLTKMEPLRGVTASYLAVVVIVRGLNRSFGTMFLSLDLFQIL